MKSKAADASINDVLAEVRALSGRFEVRFDGVDRRLDGIDGRLDGIDGRLDGMDGRLDDLGEALQDFATHVDKTMVTKEEFRSEMKSMDSKMNRLETRLVTKDYLDNKLAVFHSDLVLRMQKEDKKILELAKR